VPHAQGRRTETLPLPSDAGEALADYVQHAAGPDVLGEQFRQPGPLGEGHHGHQAAVRHEVRVIERGTDPRGGMRQSHLRGVLSDQMAAA
jgi:hypothetical protein